MQVRQALLARMSDQFRVTMDIYSQVSSASTKEALNLLGNQFGEGVL
jgi:hypothetical protein